MINENTYAEIRGNRIFMLEGVMHITEYGNERITLNCNSYTVSVRGANLCMTYLSHSRISIEGRIQTVEYTEKHNNKDNK